MAIESVAYCMDCMEHMKSLPDNYYDLVIADPPYGGGFTEGGGCKGWFTKYHQEDTPVTGKVGDSQTTSDDENTIPAYNRFGSPGSIFEKYKRSIDGTDLDGDPKKKIIAWDIAPKQEVFDEMFRVSRNQIIWGGNYFPLPPTRCFLIWRKLTISESFSMAMAEYAWTSFNSNAKVYECAPQGKASDPRFHPTAKPIDLYRWVFGLFTSPGQKVFDPFLGSGSSRIAAYEAGLNFVGTEIDEHYFNLEEERFERMAQNISFWD